MPCQTNICIDRENGSKQNLLSLGSAILWWPLYIPRLLQRDSTANVYIQYILQWSIMQRNWTQGSHQCALVVVIYWPSAKQNIWLVQINPIYLLHNISRKNVKDIRANNCHRGADKRELTWAFLDHWNPGARRCTGEESASPAWLAAPAIDKNLISYRRMSEYRSIPWK